MKIRKYNNSIYPHNCILESVEAYKDFAEIKIIHTNSSTICTFIKCKLDENKTIKEFSNYALMLAAIEASKANDY